MKNILKPVEKLITLETQGGDPKKFFINREGLYVWSSFTDNILSKSKVAKKKTFNLSAFELTKSAYDEDIEEPFSGKHIFSETDVCAIVASLIEKQPKGEEGILLNNGYANLFYTPSRVVGVYWGAYGREWRVSGWFREDEWGGGGRVFSPATDLETSDSNPSETRPSDLASLEKRISDLENWRKKVQE